LPQSKAGGFHDLNQSLFPNLLLDLFGAGNDPCRHPGGFLFPFDVIGKEPEVFDAAVGATADEDVINFLSFQLLSWLETHVFQRLEEGSAIAAFQLIPGRDGTFDANTHAGVGAVGYHRGYIRCIVSIFGIKHSIFICFELSPRCYFLLPCRTFWGLFTTLQVGKGRFVGCNHTATGATFDTHVAEGHPCLHGKGADGGTCEFNEMAGTARGRDF